MGSQFVDLNADGHVDYLTATFDGSPHVAWGSAAGFGKPEHLKDAQGERIVISYIWDFDQKKHTEVGRSMPDGQAVKERCISALAFDWDADGDHDLLLGSYENGHLYRQMNEGSNSAPAFTGKNLPVMAGDKPWAIPAKMTAPRLVDWDGDGDMDLIAGSFGDSYGAGGEGGAVYLATNRGKPGQPDFGPLEVLIEPSPKGGKAPVRPDAGLYADAADVDGDGDLDLVVGGYSMWTPEPRQLSAEEEAEAARLKKEIAGVAARQKPVSQQRTAAMEAAAAGMDRNSPETHKKMIAAGEPFMAQLTALAKEQQALKAKLDVLIPSAQRQAFVWLYERQSSEQMERYEGPKATATIEDGKDGAPHVRVDVAVPSGGYELRHDATKQIGGCTQMLLTLTEPGPDEMVMTVLETKTVQVPRGPAKGKVEVRIARVQRGVHYLVAPPHLLATTL
jgi:hypothetical protein